MKVNLLELQQVLQENGVLISFSGRFTQEIIEELGDAVQKYMKLETEQHITHDVFAVFIEQTQNVKNYTVSQAETPDGEAIVNSGIVAIGKENGNYFISSGNLIRPADAEVLTENLKQIELLDKAELKKLYKKQLRKEPNPGETSAGLGFIDMARRASAPLFYSIQQKSEQVSFFTLKVQI